MRKTKLEMQPSDCDKNSADEAKDFADFFVGNLK